MPGFRYHVVTIVSIFLALGLGIIIGSSFVETAIVDRQTRQLNELRARFNRDVVRAQDVNRRYAAFAKALAPRADGVQVALVLTGDYPDVLREARATLTSAGATVARVVALDPGFATRLGTNLERVVRDLRPAHVGMPGDIASVLGILGTVIARGGTDGDLRAFAGAGLIDYEGDYDQPVDVVVLVTGAGDANAGRAEALDVPLVDALKAVDARVMVAEPLAAEASSIAALEGRGLVTVDCADTDIGLIALVLGLQAPSGDYGVRETARSGVLPPVTITNDKRNRPGP